MSTSSQSYPMSGGDDQHSYIHNSSYQKAGIDGVQEKARQYILENLDLLNMNPNLSTFTIADFGCSIGPNTFHAVQNIIDIVKLKHLKESQEDSRVAPLEFQVYFNDLPNNDFNTLFRTQPPSSKQEYFSVGVPGSFYGRVLPRNSIHIGNTSFTTHWLSKVPEEVCDKNSLAWNKNYIHCNNLIEEVTEAYKVQFEKDMGVFLKARAEELVPGGLMITLGQCLPDGVAMYETWSGIVKDTIGDCLEDMATLYTSHWQSIIEAITNSQHHRVEWFLRRYVFQATIYIVWRERNGRRHGEPPNTASQLVGWIDKQIRNQLSSICLKGDKRYDGSLQVWFQSRS